VPPRSWKLRIEDIINAISRIVEETNGVTLDEFSERTSLREIVSYNFIVIGEAARHVPDDIQQRWSDLPWAEMRGLRNQIAHGYFGITDSIIWDTAVNDLPPLLPKLRDLLESKGERGEGRAADG
jgi:uncharacterized protein with HEPN domain